MAQEIAVPAGALTVVAHVRARGGKETDLIAASERLVPEVRKEPGCLVFQAHKGWAVPGLIVFYAIFPVDRGIRAAQARGAHTGMVSRNCGRG